MQSSVVVGQAGCSSEKTLRPPNYLCRNQKGGAAPTHPCWPALNPPFRGLGQTQRQRSKTKAEAIPLIYVSSCTNHNWRLNPGTVFLKRPHNPGLSSGEAASEVNVIVTGSERESNPEAAGWGWGWGGALPVSAVGGTSS